jgi:hypothetical protein
MTLSEAIRLGAMLRKSQARYELLDEDGGTCALGAAAEAAGFLDLATRDYLSGAKAPKEWHAVVKRETPCPTCSGIFDRLDDCIKHLNNEHRWTREAIADFVETCEAAMSAPAGATALETGATESAQNSSSGQPRG